MLKSASTFLTISFGLTLLLVPWFVGGNLPGVRTVLLSVAALSLLVCQIIPGSLGTPTRHSLICNILILSGIGWSAFQLLPFSNGSISEYPPATRERLSELVLAASMFFVACHFFRDQKLLPWGLGAIALNGVLLTFFGLAQTVSETDKLYWVYDLIHGGQPFGPFVNGNNAGGYLIMCFAAANFFLALHVYRALHLQNNSQFLEERSTFKKIVYSIGQSFAKTETRVLYMMAGVAVTTAGVAASLSRGAMVSLGVAILVGWGLLFRRNLAFAIVSLAIVSAGVGLIFWTQQNEAIVSNLETLSEFEDASPNRIAHWQDSVEYGTAYLPFGSGLGTYHVMYMPFQREAFKRWFKYAENQYLETYAELGIPGIAILLSVLAVGIWACLTLLGKPDSTSRSIGLCGLICIVGQSVAAVFDFGWFIPGNMVLFALMMGIVMGQLNWSWSASRISQNSLPLTNIWISRAIGIVLLLLSGWAIYEYSAIDARQASRRFYERFEPARDRSRVKQFQKLAEYSISVRPDDALAHYQLSLNRIIQFRLAASDEMVDDVLIAQEQLKLSQDKPDAAKNIFPERIEFTFDDAWKRSTLTSLHRLGRASFNEGPEFLQQLIDSEPVQTHLVPAWESQKRAREIFDRYWYIDMGLAQLAILMGEESREAMLITDAIQKSLTNSKMLYIGGILRNQSGDLQGAYSAWNQCLRQTRDYEAPIVQFCRNEIGIREFFEQVLPSEPYFRLRIARKFFGSESDLLVKKLLLNHTKLKLDDHELPEADRNFVLGEIERLSENYPVSIAYYKRALELDKHKVEWRVQLAKSLVSAGMLEQAMTELKVCEMYPGNHHLKCQRMIRQVKKQRMRAIKDSNLVKPLK